MINRQTILGILLLTVAIASGLAWVNAPPSAVLTGPSESTNLTARLDAREDLDPDLAVILQSIQRKLETQQNRQDELHEELVRLRQQMSASGGEAAEITTAQANLAESRVYPPDLFPRDQDERLLIEAGFSSTEAREIAERLDAIAMERLNLRYELASDNINRREYRDSLSSLPSTRELLQNTYGDDAYDRYLYGTGRSNRLVVNEVYKGSAAENIGLLPGDMVISWDNQRVYSSRDLMAIASKGNSNESVRLRVQRDGTQFELYMPWGPLGITSQQTRVDPTGE